jgi:putative hydrolase of the HAD superfamily
MIELYIFDQGGVISRDFMIGPEASRRLGLSLADFRRFVAPDDEAFMRGDFDSAEMWRRFEARSGVRAAENYWATLFHPRVDRPTFELVEELRAGLRKAGPGRVVGGTNTIAEHYAVHLAQGEYSCFDFVYASHLMGRAKPEPEFWLDILEKEGVPPERAFFTDDFPENVEAAARLGIEARLYTDADSLRRELVLLGAPVASMATPAVGAPGA